MATTHIQWTSDVWNATTGCDKVSPGCGLPRPGSDDEATGNTGGCYAMAMAKRLKAMGQAKYQKDGDPKTSGPGFGVTLHEDVLALPLRWRKPRRVFVNSMSDLFHKDVPDAFIDRVFGVMAANLHHDGPTHIFQLLTKRHARMHAYLNDPDVRWRVALAAAQFTFSGHADAVVDAIYFGDRWPLPNVHLGVSVETQQWADIRIPALLDTPAAVRWISAEPLLGPLALNPWLHGEPRLGWVVVGGESGPGARACELDWLRAIVSDCRDYRVPVFVKQLGSEWASDWTWNGRSVRALGDTKGGDPQYWPPGLHVRQYPHTPAEVA